jgi:hypothetical protein
MDLTIGDLELKDVGIPVIWGSRAIAQGSDRRLSVINLSSTPERLEILADQPAPGVNFVPILGGFRILAFREGGYDYNKNERTLTSPGGELPDCQIDDQYVRVGTEVFPKSTDYLTDAILTVSSNNVGITTQIPHGLRKLVVRNAPNPAIPEHTFILTGTSLTGQTVKIARGICECNTERDLRKEFALGVNEHWRCPDCDRTYSFDGDRIKVAASSSPLGPIGAMASR